MITAMPKTIVGGNGHLIAVEDKLIVWADNHHGHNNAEIVPRDITNWPEKGNGPVFPPHYTTSAYSGAAYVSPYSTGRLFIRGADGIYAYDLRTSE